MEQTIVHLLFWGFMAIYIGGLNIIIGIEEEDKMATLLANTITNIISLVCALIFANTAIAAW